MERKDNNETKKQFLEADKIMPKIESSIHPNHMYTSKPINIKISDASNSSRQNTFTQVLNSRYYIKYGCDAEIDFYPIKRFDFVPITLSSKNCACE
ncbi:17956_t:CDS:2 [Cetraspora pellucida]|uniref:17956_t:CDS:1 n=1 Tax=Cetraspora pellucida TaxID=1433469 RepID=A0A9N9F274_9GLOM|nr:17956_t:CDS:2 [Cetraspora pellucida]